jgi:hypothetical protein
MAWCDFGEGERVQIRALGSGQKGCMGWCPIERWPGHKIWMEFLREKGEEAIQAMMVLGGKERERGKVYGGSI